MSLVTLVAERMARPSYWPMIAFSSSGVLPVITSTSQPRSLKMRCGVGVHLVGNEDFGFGHVNSLSPSVEMAGLRGTRRRFDG